MCLTLTVDTRIALVEILLIDQLAFTCLKSTIEAPGPCVEYVQSQQ